MPPTKSREYSENRNEGMNGAIIDSIEEYGGNNHYYN